MKTKKAKKNRVNVITLGCSKNLVDSEVLLGQLKANQFEATHESQSETDIVIINTCGFIDRAKEESIQTILTYAEEKMEQNIDKVYVTGCLSERYKTELEKEIPEVDAWFGTMELPALLHKLEADYKSELIGERFLTTEKHYAYLKISEGCNRTCSFCAIPLMRGKHISRTIESLVAEAKHLASQGVKEIMLIAQELTYYGLDIYKKRALSDLLEALHEVDGIVWIRLHYAYPSKFPMDVLETMARLPKICKYLDIPLQHISNGILQAMKRQISKEETKELIEKAREIVPNIAIRTTFLVGFPGESDSDFQELLSFIKEMKFERVGVFQYSHEENTSAYELEDDVPVEIKEFRAQMLMETQREISAELNHNKIGKKTDIVIDRIENQSYIGRTQFDSPEVDNEVIIPFSADYHLPVGSFLQVQITDATEYDLYAIPL